MELDITSLLDILVIMLVFLLKSYNSSGIVFNVPKGITLPDSRSMTLNTTGVIIQVSPTHVYVDDKEVLSTEKRERTRTFDHGGRRIIPLYNELIRKKQMIKRIEKSAPNAKKFSGVANLIIDKTLKYSFIKKIMYTCADAGFKKYKFVVLGEEQ
jgi:biopolymer transport protein ExbD